MSDEKSAATAARETKMGETELESSLRQSHYTSWGFINSGSTTLNVLISIITVPIQGLAILLFARGIQQLVLCIDEVYEATGRRSRSKFVTFPWVRVGFGVLLLAAYHVGLLKLTVKSWKALRRGSEGAR
jgi:hypothetical protein